MKQIKIAPSILSADFSKMGEEVQMLERSGADIIHCDVMDGVFVNNITFGIKMVEDLRKITTLPLDCHLMIVHPEKYVERFAKAGADIITVHIEACEDVAATLQKIRSLGIKSGLSLKPKTPVESLVPYLELCDLMLVMSVEPGFGGQKFMADMMPKCAFLRDYAEKHGLDYEISVDGGVSAENARLCVESGANVLVAGSSVLGKDDIKKAAEELLAAANRN